MKLVKTIRIEMSDWNPRQQFGESAVVGDSGGRILEFELREKGKEWVVPEGFRPALAFRNAAGYAGEYDTMPDGTAAYDVEGSRIRMQLVDQITAATGQVKLMLVLRDDALRQVSSFPFFVEVAEGIEGVEPLPQVYFRVSGLEQMNRELERIEQMLAEMDGEIVLNAAREAREAANNAKAWAASVNAEEIAAAIAQRGDDLCIRDGRLYLTSGDRILGEGAALTELGSGAVMMLTTECAPVFAILEQEERCVISYTWSSLAAGMPTGSGVAQWSVNGSRAALEAVEQGEREFDVRPLLSAGAENAVELKVTDVYGNVRTLSFSITVTAYGLSWNLAEAAIHEAALSVRLIPTGTGEKKLKVAVDGTVVYESTVTTNGRTVVAIVPNQSHGAHVVTAWVEVPELGVRTEPLCHMGVWLRAGNEAPIVGVLNPQVAVSRYGTAAIRWVAVDPMAENATVELKADGVTVRSLQNVGRGVQTWTYQAAESGEHILSIHCGSSSGQVALTVTEPGYQVTPVTAGLELDLDPAGHCNAEIGREEFGYLDPEGVVHPLRFSENFDWISGGFREDEEGVTALVIKRGCSVILDRGFFDSDCRSTGRHLKLIFKSDHVRNFDAKLMECTSGGIGLTVQAHGAAVTSQLEHMQVSYCQGRRIELDVCIQSEDEGSMAWIDLKGIQSCPPIRYRAADTWGQTSPVVLTIGSEDADVWVYRMKLWGNSLNRHEVLDEYIACAGSADEMGQRYARNDIYNTDGTLNLGKVAGNNPQLRVIHLRAPRMTTGEADVVTGDLEMVYTAGGEGHHLSAQGICFQAQGTADEYALVALDLDVNFSSAESLVNGLGQEITGYSMTENSIPAARFLLKANVSSSEGCNNVCLSQEYNTWNPYVCDARRMDSRVRDTVEGHPCAVFFTSTAQMPIQVGARTVQPGETILYFVGDMINSRESFAVFGQSNDVYPKQCCVEIMNNTEPACRFREAMRSDEKWEGGNFEFRFPRYPTQEMKDAFIRVQRWLVGTDRVNPTGGELANPVELEGVLYTEDTAAYRAAKFRCQFADYFVPEAMDFHYLFTDFNCMTDSRSRNLFFCYEYVAELDDYRWSVRCVYDNSIALGNANVTYGMEDTDMVGDSWVFHGHDSVLWCNIRDLRSEELRSLYNRLAEQGAWDAKRRAELFRNYQSAVCEALRCEDMHNKYFLPWKNQDAAAYACMCLGTKEEQREQFLWYQQVYKGSQYCDGSNRADAISINVKLEQAENGNLTISTYLDLYVIVRYGNSGTIRQRVKRNTPTMIGCPADALGDMEICIFSAGSLTGISSLADMKPKAVMANGAQRLQELVIGSGEMGYSNPGLKQIGVPDSPMLQTLDIRGCPNLAVALDLTRLTALEQFLASGSGITGVSFARGCPLKEIRLPAVESLTARELQQVEKFVMDPSRLKLLLVENCPGIDTCSICKEAGNLLRGRITGMDWSDGNADLICSLMELPGYDSQGTVCDRFVLAGKAHIQTITQQQIDAIAAAFPELELSYDTVVESVTVTFLDFDGTVLDQQIIPKGGDATNPVTAGVIATPERESDVECHYRFTGWDRALTNIQEDTRVTAVYAVSDRFYRVTFWTSAAEQEICQEELVIVHSAVEYIGDAPEENGKIWIGWDADTTDVVADLDVHPVFLTPRLPDSVPEEFDYLYSDDSEDSSAFSMEEFAGVVLQGQSRNYFRVGDRIRIVAPKNDVFPDGSFVLRVEAFDRFRLADGSDFAGAVFGMVGVMNADMAMNGGTNTATGWRNSRIRAFLNGSVWAQLPLYWQALIRQVQVRALVGDGTEAVEICQDQLFLPAVAEVDSGRGYPYTEELDPEVQSVTLPGYPSADSRVKCRFSGLGEAVGSWWSRSACMDASGSFMIVKCTDGSGQTEAASGDTASGISWMCCM